MNPSPALPRPTRADLEAARRCSVPDILGPNLHILFCGINPSLYSAAVGHHFARPGNRFWPALHAAGFTDRLYAPWEDGLLLKLGYGITNIAAPATATADELTEDELRTGARQLRRKVRRHRPTLVAFLGITAYRIAFDQKKARLGRQNERLEEALVWVLPNPSGLNAHYQLSDLARVYSELRHAATVYRG